MNRITPHLWFDRQAREAADFYVSIFPDSHMGSVKTLHNTPSGDVDLVSFELAGQGFMAISAGPLFRFNPSISFLFACRTKDEVDRLWTRLSEGGTPRMPLGAYPFSERYGWTEDRYGLSWQIMLAGDRPIRQRITPTLMFTDGVCGRAEEAVAFYTSVFPDSHVDHLMRYGSGDAPDREGALKHGGFTLANTEFAAMDSARVHDAPFNEAISLVIQCGTQEEIDHYSDRLSSVPQAEQCGWLKDRYGVSWQVAPAIMGDMMQKGTKEQNRASHQRLPADEAIRHREAEGGVRAGVGWLARRILADERCGAFDGMPAQCPRKSPRKEPRKGNSERGGGVGVRAPRHRTRQAGCMGAPPIQESDEAARGEGVPASEKPGGVQGSPPIQESDEAARGEGVPASEEPGGVQGSPPILSRRGGRVV